MRPSFAFSPTTVGLVLLPGVHVEEAFEWCFSSRQGMDPDLKAYLSASERSQAKFLDDLERCRNQAGEASDTVAEVSSKCMEHIARVIEDKYDCSDVFCDPTRLRECRIEKDGLEKEYAQNMTVLAREQQEECAVKLAEHADKHRAASRNLTMSFDERLWEQQVASNKACQKKIVSVSAAIEADLAENHASVLKRVNKRKEIIEAKLDACYESVDKAESACDTKLDNLRKEYQYLPRAGRHRRSSAPDGIGTGRQLVNVTLPVLPAEFEDVIVGLFATNPVEAVDQIVEVVDGLYESLTAQREAFDHLSQAHADLIKRTRIVTDPELPSDCVEEVDRIQHKLVSQLRRADHELERCIDESQFEIERIGHQLQRELAVAEEQVAVVTQQCMDHMTRTLSSDSIGRICDDRCSFLMTEYAPVASSPVRLARSMSIDYQECLDLAVSASGVNSTYLYLNAVAHLEQHQDEIKSALTTFQVPSPRVFRDFSDYDVWCTTATASEKQFLTLIAQLMSEGNVREAASLSAYMQTITLFGADAHQQHLLANQLCNDIDDHVFDAQLSHDCAVAKNRFIIDALTTHHLDEEVPQAVELAGSVLLLIAAVVGLLIVIVKQRFCPMQ